MLRVYFMRLYPLFGTFTADHDRTKRHVRYYAAPTFSMGPPGPTGKSSYHIYKKEFF